jgi:hypothetical protein
VCFTDAGDVEFEALLTQEMLDGLTVEHYKILYLVSKYSQFAERVTDNERWIRFQPLLVLMVGRCRMTVSKFVIKVSVGSGIEYAVSDPVRLFRTVHFENLTD